MNILTIVTACMLCSASIAQGVKISPTPGTPDPSAGLDVDYTNKGALFPRMTSAQRQSILTPATGLLVYQTDAPEGFWYNSGTPGAPNWVQVIQNPVNTNVDMSNNYIQNLPLPVNNADAVNKAYVDALVASGGGGTPVGIPTMMSNESGSQFTLSQAVNYCANLTESGHSDWRLPTFDEIAYFFGSTTNTNFVWTKTMADGKENPANQNYISARLSDGKWRAGGTALSLEAATSFNSGSTTNYNTTWTTDWTYQPLNPANVFIPTRIYLRGLAASGVTTYFRIKFNYADGTSVYSSVYTANSSSYTTFRDDLYPHPFNSIITPLFSIQLESYASNSSYYARAILQVDGFEVSMSQKDGATLFTRCVR